MIVNLSKKNEQGSNSIGDSALITKKHEISILPIFNRADLTSNM